MKLFIFVILLVLSILGNSYAGSSSSISSSSSSSDNSMMSSDSGSGSDNQHYIFAFQINLNPGDGQYFILINPDTNTVLKNVSINTPADFIINGILSYNQTSNNILLLGLSGEYASNSILSYNINTGRCEVYESMVSQFNCGYAVQPFIYTPLNSNTYMAIEPLYKVPAILAVANWEFKTGKRELIELKIENNNYTTDIFPLIAYDQNSELLYVTYSPGTPGSNVGNKISNETNLIIIDINDSKNTQKQFSNIGNGNLTSSENNQMLITSPTNGSLYLIQSNQEGNGMEMCEIDLSDNSCNNVFSATMIKDFMNAPFNPFQLTLDNTGLIIMNLVHGDTKGTFLTELSIIDIDSLFPIASYTIDNYFNTTNPAIQYYISYI